MSTGYLYAGHCYPTVQAVFSAWADSGKYIGGVTTSGGVMSYYLVYSTFTGTGVQVKEWYFDGANWTIVSTTNSPLPVFNTCETTQFVDYASTSITGTVNSNAVVSGSVTTTSTGGSSGGGATVDPVANTADGIAIGWAIALAMTFAWGMRLIRRAAT